MPRRVGIHTELTLTTPVVDIQWCRTEREYRLLCALDIRHIEVQVPLL